MMNTLPYVDVLFGNESEAVTFAESQKWEGITDVAEIALKISQMPKASDHCTRTKRESPEGSPKTYLSEAVKMIHSGKMARLPFAFAHNIDIRYEEVGDGTFISKVKLPAISGGMMWVDD